VLADIFAPARVTWLFFLIARGKYQDKKEQDGQNTQHVSHGSPLLLVINDSGQ
jgi:hypothetical protein